MSSRDQNTDQPELPKSGPVGRLLELIAGAVWWSILVVLVLLALYAGIGRQLTAQVDRFSDRIAAEISAQTGLGVDITRLSSSWNWLDPSLTASGLTLSNPDSGRTIAELEHLRLRLDFLASVSRLRLVFEDFEADGLVLTLIRAPGDQLSDPVEQMAELEPLNEGAAREWLKLAGQWLSEPEVRITRVSLAIGQNEDHLRHLYIPRLDLLYTRGLFQASGRAMQSGTATQLASFALVGQRFFRGDFTGQLYVDVDSGRLFDGLIDDLSWRGIRVEGFDLGGRAWLTFENGTLQQIQGTLETPYLQLGVGMASLAPLEDISTRFGWRRGGDLMLQQLQWQWDGDQVEPFSVRLLNQPDSSALVADAVPLGPIRRLVRALSVLPEVAEDALDHYRPTGYLDDMLLDLPEQTRDFMLSGQVRGLGVEPWGGAPGATGLNGRLQLTADQGFVELDTHQPVTLGFPELYTGSWTFNAMTGRVSWQVSGGVSRVRADDLVFSYQDNTRLTGAFELRLDRAGDDYLGLRVGVENAEAGMLAEFVPSKVVDEGLYQWLTTRITEADITGGQYYGHGRIDSGAPNGSFVSSMWYEFENARVRYDDRWPEVEAAAGRVEVQNADTLVTLNRARTGGLEVSEGVVRVVPGSDEQPTRVLVDVASGVPGEAVAWWMANSPLGELAGQAVSGAGFAGQFQLGLNIDIPLSDGADTAVQARVQTENGGFRLPGPDLSWTGIRTDLTYHTERGFSGGPVHARFMDQPVSVSFTQNAAGDALSIRQDGRLALPAFLQQWEPGEDSSFGLAGTLDYSAGMRIDASGPSSIVMTSDLAGLNVDWPEPLGKTADQTAQLEARVDPFAPEGVRITGDWQDRMAFDLLWKESAVDLQFDYLSLGSHRLTDITISALDLGDRWVVNTESERAAGRVVIPQGDGVVEVDLHTLHLSREDASTEQDQAPELLTLEQQLEAFRQLDIGSWPDVDGRISNLKLGDESAGSWSFRLRPAPHQLNVEAIEGRLGALELSGDMVWRVVDDRETTRFQGQLTGGALKDLEALTGSSIPLTNQATAVELDIDWPGGPNDIGLSALSGEVSVRLDDGVILEQNNSAQLFRVFNLLNTDTLWRRLRLDFSDLYERGVAFDAISGKARISDGLVTMDPELQLVGPSGAFKINGSTNMADESLDMRLVVVLPVTQNLPLAAILMGASAPIGGALFVLDKILGDPLSKLTSATYSVTGSWSEPEVDLRSVFDTAEQ
ncbi:hypothetical protein B9Q17_15305 [Marinobacter vinifirmus]|uniref:YhdP central domain-containing protein n=1 Tax=Marinobacter vinifirmus TaxID=355591 RepID=A0A7Z1E011_9GAMM|nr:AsmA-like C-terminal region-containing protein [Marinobacter vinifirmus]OZC37907.1 hypothetical protein B9Q17_15305 [Marinobacter vinifirmus]